ncbi:hypothetical protein C5E45_20595 [Nocardia nova]|uniref:Uncharacterized protein n=1 Tax=Nocardia nova TaxID=37330 RepID=A0A2S6AML9_9NOCA|nr:hypothetical protein [Nocardia nova]PPJ36446.1 hypothetical protein C5E45_20595 [Nocardia nova]
MSTYPNGNELVDKWELARVTYRGFIMKVSVQRGEIVLEVLDHRRTNITECLGFRQFRRARHSGPVFAPGDLIRDMEIAREWLQLHKAHIYEREVEK